MNIDNEIGIDKGLRDELLDNVYFKYELKKCLEKHIRQDLSLVNGKLINNNDNYFKVRDGTITAEYKTCIGKITIHQDIKSGNILVLKVR